jgi:titin
VFLSPPATANHVEGNRIGTDATGTVPLGNGTNGVTVFGTTQGNTIGGTTPGAGNIVSGNRAAGIELLGGGIGGGSNLIQGNFIGTDAAGTHALGNQVGVQIDAQAGANTIGGAAAGARNVISGNRGDGIDVAASATVIWSNFIGTNATGTAAVGNTRGVVVRASADSLLGNLISGNRGNGVELDLPGGGRSVVQGNYIGTDTNGSVALPNDGVGVAIQTSGNLIGGIFPGQGNVISGNRAAGVEIFSGTANTILGNLIGVNATGTSAVANFDGIQVDSGAGSNFVGATAASAGNVISGNTTSGILLAGGGNVVQGNLIGTDATGTSALANATGVAVTSPNNTLGGTTAGARNVISGNRFDGVEIDGAGGNVVAGNLIGTDVTGTRRLGNGQFGVSVNGTASTNNLIGGTADGARNILSGNGFGGVLLAPGAHGNRVQGNYIGTDLSGSAAIGNTGFGTGVGLTGANDNLIGGTAAGAGNVLSGNNVGVSIASSIGNQIQGNRIGTDATGSVALGNLDGIFLGTGANGNFIGGATAGAGNVISGNVNFGVVFDRNATGNQVQGNSIGTDVTGTQAVGNLIAGIQINTSNNNVIGGTDAGAGNIISGNQGDGIEINFSTGTVIQGNYIGTDATGAAALGNRRGVAVLATETTIGGTSTGAGNVISGNREAGVDLSSVNNIDILGNQIGTDASGTQALGNGSAGIFLLGGTNVRIGGTAPGAGNVISGNAGDGIFVQGSSTTGIVVQGNQIGTDVSGTLALGNVGNGVNVVGGAHANTIGGTPPGAGNVIAFNGGDGVRIDTGTGNAILRNSIFANAGLGIELLNHGNNDQPAPVLTSAVSGGGFTTIQGTFTGRPSTTYLLEFFADSNTPAQGKRFLGAVVVTTDAMGHANIVLTIGVELDPGMGVTATATDPANNTSAFSAPVVVTN